MYLADTYVKDSDIQSIFYDDKKERAVFRFSFDNSIHIVCTKEEYLDAIKVIKEKSF
jgi:hypothetical protein